MRKTRGALLFIEVILIMLLSTGCWNYRELNKLAIVAGMAIDKGKENNYLITMELVDLSMQQKNTVISSKLIQMEGETIFDAVRNVVKISGKKLYFSHIKVVILSQEIAKEGLVNVIDWFNRDAESRLTLHVLVSKEKTASELLSQQSTTSPIRSYEMENMLLAQNSIEKAPNIQIHDLINNLSGEGVCAYLPSIGVILNEGVRTSELSGTAVFKKDKFVGFLDENETKNFLFVKNNIKGGVIVDRQLPGSKETNISLEIYKSKTKIKPEYTGGKLSMNINVEAEVSVGEIGTTKNYASEEEINTLKKHFERKMEEDIEKVIKKVQEKYDADIFGFGRIVRGDLPNVWRKVGDNWDEEFKNLEVNVDVKLNIRDTGLAIKTIKVGD